MPAKLKLFDGGETLEGVGRLVAAPPIGAANAKLLGGAAALLTALGLDDHTGTVTLKVEPLDCDGRRGDIDSSSMRGDAEDRDAIGMGDCDVHMWRFLFGDVRSPFPCSSTGD
jgi:hypothetical protein